MGNDPDLYGSLFETGGSANYFQSNSETIDNLFAQAAVELDTDKREALYDDLQKPLLTKRSFTQSLTTRKS